MSWHAWLLRPLYLFSIRREAIIFNLHITAFLIFSLFNSFLVWFFFLDLFGQGIATWFLAGLTMFYFSNTESKPFPSLSAWPRIHYYFTVQYFLQSAVFVRHGRRWVGRLALQRDILRVNEQLFRLMNKILFSLNTSFSPLWLYFLSSYTCITLLARFLPCSSACTIVFFFQEWASGLRNMCGDLKKGWVLL